MYTLVISMQSAQSADIAEQARWKIEEKYLFHQVLTEECVQLIDGLLRGLSNATIFGEAETWELFSLIAASAATPTVESDLVVSKVRNSLTGVIESAINLISGQFRSNNEFLAVDVIDSAIEFMSEELRRSSIWALKCFAERGEREKIRVNVILRDIAGQ